MLSHFTEFFKFVHTLCWCRVCIGLGHKSAPLFLLDNFTHSHWRLKWCYWIFFRKQKKQLFSLYDYSEFDYTTSSRCSYHYFVTPLRTLFKTSADSQSRNLSIWNCAFKQLDMNNKSWILDSSKYPLLGITWDKIVEAGLTQAPVWKLAWEKILYQWCDTFLTETSH